MITRSKYALHDYKSVKLLQNKNSLLVGLAVLLCLILGVSVSNQSLYAPAFSGLRIVVHVFSDPSENANISMTDHDRKYFDSKNVTTGLDGSKIVEFSVPPGEIDVNEPYYVHAVTNSSSCGDVSGYNRPEYVSEYIDLYLVPCDLT